MNFYSGTFDWLISDPALCSCVQLTEAGVIKEADDQL